MTDSDISRQLICTLALSSDHLYIKNRVQAGCEKKDTGPIDTFPYLFLTIKVSKDPFCGLHSAVYSDVKNQTFIF